jgi:hypothetical protein
MTNTNDKNNAAKNPLSGLVLFCAIAIAAMSLFYMTRLYAYYDYLSQIGGFSLALSAGASTAQVYISAYLLIYSVIACVYALASILILMERRVCVRYINITFPICILLVLLNCYIAIKVVGATIPSLLLSAGTGILFPIVIMLYINLSKRIKQIFGRQSTQ